jgi:hypothetical protein
MNRRTASLIVGSAILAVFASAVEASAFGDPHWDAKTDATPTATHPYAGFWKTDCNDPFGLAIGPSDAKSYYISFCGPGGCFPKGQRTSPIVGDSSFRIVDENTLEIQNAQGFERHFRCTSAQVASGKAQPEPARTPIGIAPNPPVVGPLDLIFLALAGPAWLSLAMTAIGSLVFLIFYAIAFRRSRHLSRSNRWAVRGAAFGISVLPLSLWLYAHFFTDPIRALLMGFPGLFLLAHFAVIGNPSAVSQGIVINSAVGVRAALHNRIIIGALAWALIYGGLGFGVGKLRDAWQGRKEGEVAP